MRFSLVACVPVASLLSLISFVDTAFAANPARMMAECRSYAGRSLGTRLPNIETKYEGQRTDGTHAVNGSASVGSRIETFQCTFNASGRRITRFVVNRNSAIVPPSIGVPGQGSVAEYSCLSAVASQVGVPAFTLSVRNVSRGRFRTIVVVNVPGSNGLAPWQCDYARSRVQRVMYIGRN